MLTQWLRQRAKGRTRGTIRKKKHNTAYKLTRKQTKATSTSTATTTTATSTQATNRRGGAEGRTTSYVRANQRRARGKNKGEHDKKKKKNGSPTRGSSKPSSSLTSAIMYTVPHTTTRSFSELSVSEAAASTIASLHYGEEGAHLHKLVYHGITHGTLQQCTYGKRYPMGRDITWDTAVIFPWGVSWDVPWVSHEIPKYFYMGNTIGGYPIHGMGYATGHCSNFPEGYTMG